MAMHKQYAVEVKTRSMPDRWQNAVWFETGCKQHYVRTEVAAQTVLEGIHKRFDHAPYLFIIESRIRVREVSDWELVQGAKVLGVSEEG